MGELSKLLMGAKPKKALKLAYKTGVLAELIPEWKAIDEALAAHIFAVVQETANAGDDLAVRLATFFHDVGKPIDRDPIGHARVGAEIANRTLLRLRYPTRLSRRVVAIVREHPFRAEDLPNTPRDVRRFLAQHGDELAFDLVAHRRADLRAKDMDATPVEELGAALERELANPHRLGDLAIDGTDLIELGFAPGPALGRALETLLTQVVDEPELNSREELLRRAKGLL
jgi:putative nucleotidyltransferase with HDIG domain